MILITGAAGFIGSALVWACNQHGKQDLVLVDQFGSGEKWKNLLGSRFWYFVDRDELFEALQEAPWAPNITAVLHMGACSATTEQNVDYLYRTNTEYSQRLCQWCMQHDVRFIYASSAATYGDGAHGFSDDDTLTPQLRPLNAYGFSKWVFDQWVIDHGYSEKVIGLRFFNVFGPNEYHKDTMASVIFRSFALAQTEHCVRLFESHRPDYEHGGQLRDFVYIKDVADVVWYFLENAECNGIVNVGTGQARSFGDLGRALLDALAVEGEIRFFPMPETLRPKYQYFTEADISKLRKLGYKHPFMLLEDSVRDYVQQYLAQGPMRLCEKSS